MSKETRLFVYIGKVRLQGGKKGHGMLELPSMKERLFDGKIQKRMPLFVGNIYSMDVEQQEGSESLNVWFGSLQFVRKFEDEQQIIEWRLQDDRFDIVDRMEKKNKNAGSDEVFEKALEPIVKAYDKTDSLGRMVIELKVLRYLRSFQRKMK